MFGADPKVRLIRLSFGIGRRSEKQTRKAEKVQTQ